MKIGSYKNLKEINFQDWEEDKISLTLFDPILYGGIGCGYNLLSTLTGKPPAMIKTLNSSKSHCSDQFITNFLHKHRFKTLELTKCLLTNHASNYLLDKISPYHVLITSQLVKKNECSWFLIYHGKYMIHNQTVDKMKIFDFLNFPLQSVFLVKKI